MPVTFTSIRFQHFKAFRDFSVSLQRMNILVGPNNCGKSTIVSAFRIIEVALKQAFSRRAIHIPSFRGGHTFGHMIPTEHIPVATENVHTDYEDTDSIIAFRVSNGNRLFLHFPADGGCYISWETQGADIHTPGLLRRAFPIKIQVIPVLGPLEHEEPVLAEDTVKRALNTHRASRHFRNYWRYFPDGFDDYANLVASSWPGMEVEHPELVSVLDRKLTMMCRENRISREIFWAGFGFQIWCQLLTHISRASDTTILIVDEPEIYLHPDVQRQLIGILRDIAPDILLATHSTEIMGEADSGEIILIDKRKRAGERLKDIEGVQRAHEVIGSVQNITLTQLARTKKILFVEGNNDYKIIRRFAKKLEFQVLSAGTDITALESGGFSSWEKIKALSWGLNKTIGANIFIGAIYDRDYWSEEEIKSIKEELDENLDFSHIHDRKEIENYLLVPSVLERVLEKAIHDRERRTSSEIVITETATNILLRITGPKQSDIQGQYLAKRSEFLRSLGQDIATINAETLKLFNKKWAHLDTRLFIVPGKETLREFRAEVEQLYNVTLTDIRIIDEFTRDEVPDNINQLIQSLESCRIENTN